MPQRFVIVSAHPSAPDNENEEVFARRDGKKYAKQAFDVAKKVLPGYIIRMYDYLAINRNIPIQEFIPDASTKEV